MAGTVDRMSLDEEGRSLARVERLDDLQRSGLVITRIPLGSGFQWTLCSCQFATVSGDRVVDLGTGTGVIPLLVWAEGSRGDSRHRNPGRDG